MKRTHRAALALSFLFSSPLTALAVPVITSTKDDATAAATRKVAGDNIDYTIQISNSGADPATGVTLTDPTPANTTLVPASVNVSPLAFDDAYVAVGNTTLRVGNPAATTGPSTSNATKVTANDTEFLGDAFTISTFQAASANGGTVAMVTSGVDAGSFSYLPAAGFEGVDTFTYTITDDGSTGFAAMTSVGTVSITVSEVVWYVDDTAAPGGTGRSNAPLQVLTTLNVAATDPDEADDYIFVYSGNYSGAFTLEAGQRFIGEPAGLTVGGLTIAAGGTRPAFSHNATSNLTLASGNTVRSMNFTNTAGGGITGSAVGTLTLSDFDVTVTGGTALNLTTSGTVTATGTDNDLTSTTGTALNVANVTIGGTGLPFKSISAGNNTAAADPVSGIILNATGAGGLTVAGDGGAANNGSGGVIQNTTGPGINLTSTGPINLGYMNVTNCGDDGIRGATLASLTLNRSNITTNGNAVGERGLDLTQISGSGGITNSTISGSSETNVRLENDTANLTAFNVTGTTISTTNFTTGDDGFLVLDTGSASMTVSVTGCTFTDNKGDHFQAATDADASGPMNITFNNNTLTTTAANDPNVIGGGITINTSGTTDITFQVNNNNIQQAFDDGININLDPGSQIGSSMNGTISGNIIGTAGQDDSGSESSNTITVASKGRGTTTIAVTNNTINEWANAYGIFVGSTEGSSNVNATVTGNSVKNGGTFALNAIRVDAGATSGPPADNGLIEVTLTGNNVTASMPGVVGAGDDIRLRQRFSTTIKLPGYTGSTSDTTAVAAFVATNNDPAGATPAPTVTAAHNVGGGGGGYIGGADNLLFAPGSPGGNPGSSQAIFPQQEGAAPVVPDRSELPTANAISPKPRQTADDYRLCPSDLDPLLSAAIARWEASGLTGEQLLAMQRMSFSVEEMPGLYLGKAEGNHITLDANAAGNRWFIDRTPGEDSEFTGSGTRLAATTDGDAAGRVDALTTIVHELGHAVGLDDSYLEADRDRIMYGFLHLSERRLPRSGEAQGAKVHNHTGKPHTHYLAAPITIGTLPPNKTVTVVYRVTVNAGITAPSVTNQGTISGTNFANVSTDDLPQPGGAANPTVTVIEVPPVVSNFARSTAEDTVLNFTAANFTGAYTDANSDALTTMRITSLPANGTLKLVAANVTLNQDIPAAQLGNLNYTPNGDYNGADSFNWNASDGVLFAVAGATVNLTVTEVNDPPSAVADPQPNVAEDAAPIVIAASGLTTNDSKGPANESTQTLTVTAVSAPVGGTVNLAAGNITFTLTPDFNGAASFTYTVTDNGTTNGAAAPLTANGTVSFTVTEVNDAPVAVDDTRPNVAEDAAPIVFAASTLATNDTKGAANESAQTLTVTAVNNPTGGTVVLNAGNITFTLTPNYNGPAGFEYTVADNGTTNGAADPKTDVGLVSFTVTSVNDDPLAAADTIQRYPTQSVKVPKATLLANDTDSDGGTPAFVSVSAASANGGTVTSDATQVFYTPAVGFTGTDTFTYTINDGQGGTANGTVNVAIIPDESAGMSVAKVETLGDGSVRVTFAGIPGRTYRVQSSETMAPGSWTTRATLPADAQGRFQFTDPPPLPPTRLYRSVQP